MVILPNVVRGHREAPCGSSPDVLLGWAVLAIDVALAALAVLAMALVVRAALKSVPTVNI